MEPAEFSDNIKSGSEVEVIGVSEDDLGIYDIDHLIWGEGFDHTLCANGHKYRRRDIAMSGC